MAQYFYNFRISKLSIPEGKELIRMIEIDVAMKERRYLKALGVR